MPSPSAALTTLRPDLAGSLMAFDLAASRAGFVAQRILPVVNVAKQAGVFGSVPLGSLLQPSETRRAPGSGYSRGTWTFSTTSFSCEEHGHEEPVDDRQAAMYAEYFDAELVATQRSIDAILRKAEIRVAALIYNTSTWTGSTLTTAITNEWDDYANATPITDVMNASQRVFNGCGFHANALLLNRKQFKHACQCDDIKEAIHSQGAGQSIRMSEITPQLLASALDLDYVLVADAAYNSAKEGQTVVPAAVWSDEYMMVCRVATTNDIAEPCIGRTFHWSEDGSQPGGTIESYRDETVRSEIIRARFDVDEVVLLAAAGHLISNALTI